MNNMSTFVGALALLVPVVASAAPATFTHQGRLLDSAGVPLEGDHVLTFMLHDDPASGSAVWTETLDVTLESGYYSEVLGTETAIIVDDFAAADELYLGVSVDGGAELSRLELTSVPWALFAQKADTAVNVDGGVVNASEIQIAGQTVIDSSGAITGSSSWNTLTDVPDGFLDGVDNDELADLSGECLAGEIPTWDGTVWACSEITPDLLTGTIDISNLPVGDGPGQVKAGDAPDADALGSLSCSDGQVAAMVDGEWSCSTPSDLDTLSELTCSEDQVAVFNGSAWVCGDAATGGGALLLSVDFDENSGTSFADSASGQTVSAIAGGVAGGSTGHTGKAAAFTGGGVAVDSGNNVATSPYVTVEAWVRPTTSLSGTQTIVARDGSWTLSHTDGAVELTAKLSNGQSCTVTHVGKLKLNEWQHVSAYYNGREAAVLLNGGATVDACEEGPLVAGGGEAISIAATAANGSPFSGFVDELRVWSTAPVVTGINGVAVAAPDNATCATLRAAGNTSNGTYEIDPDGAGGMDPFDVYCDMGNGGWTYKAQGVPFTLEHQKYAQAIVTPLVETTYRFTAWGASSGLKLTGTETPMQWDGVSQGGSAVGDKTFAPGTELYAYVGGRGASAGPMDSGACRSNYGGWNGGGLGSRGGAGGGGATDVRLRLGDLNSRFIVAGGGGGCGYGGSACDYLGGNGGGTTGGNGRGSGNYAGGKGGSQTAGGIDGNNSSNGAGSFGRGGDAVQCNDEGGGGGGWYGGGAGGEDNRPGGGGSSYIQGLDNASTQQGGRNGDGVLTYIFQ